MICSSAISINYERSLISFSSYKTYFNLGLGRFALSDLVEYGISGFCVPISFNNIIGQNKSHFEFDFGVRYLFAIKDKYGYYNNSFTFFTFNKLIQKNIYPIANIGYRYTASNRGVFRLFIGLSGVGFGAGYSF